MDISTITSKGQTTIPVEVRRHLQLKAGDKVRFFIEDDGKAVIIPLMGSVLRLKGMLKTDKRFTDKEIKKAIGQRVAQKTLKSLQP